MIAGGAEAPLNFGTLKAWEALRTLAAADADDPSASCKPFDRRRGGLVLGEGAAMMVLEDRERAMARGATILAEVAGYGLCTDATHITRPSVAGQAEAMSRALENAAMDAGEIGYINAHGTGTQARHRVRVRRTHGGFDRPAPRLAPVLPLLHLGEVDIFVERLALVKEDAHPKQVSRHENDGDANNDEDDLIHAQLLDRGQSGARPRSVPVRPARRAQVRRRRRGRRACRRPPRGGAAPCRSWCRGKGGRAGRASAPRGSLSPRPRGFRPVSWPRRCSPPARPCP